MKYPKALLISISSIIAVDLMIKAFIVNTFDAPEMNEVIPGFISIGRIETLRGAFGFQNSLFTSIAIQLVFQALIVLLAIRIYRRHFHYAFHAAFLMIIAGWLGEYLDWVFLGSGRLEYVSTAYLYFHFLDPVFSLSSIVISLGWILLLFCIVVFFKELKQLFEKPRIKEKSIQL